MIVSVVCPCRNELAHIDGFCHDLANQLISQFDLEVIIADGNSDDGTLAALAGWCARDPRLRVIPNPARIVSTGLNEAIRQARGDIIVRMDVHTRYASDYVSQCVHWLQKTDAKCVGGPWIAKGTSLTQRAIAAAFASPFGSGGAKSRRLQYSGPVDTVYLGTWWRRDLLAWNGFDETLVRNQDDELCLRIARLGGTVWQSSAIRSVYVPRDSLGALWRQYYQYGYWKVAVARKHKLAASTRQLAPTFLVALLVALIAAAVLGPWGLWPAATVLIVYTLAAATFAGRVAEPPHRLGHFALTFASFFCMHFSYGLGFAHGIVDFLVLRRLPTEAMSRPSR